MGQTLVKKYDDRDDEDLLGIEKGAVLQEARVFNDPQLDPRRCNQVPSEEPFDINSVPKEVKSQPVGDKKATGQKSTGLGAPPSAPASSVDAYEKLLSSIPEFSTFGKLFKSSPPVELTQAETGVAVNVVKHIFDLHVVFQYNCTNTDPEQLLEEVTVIVDASKIRSFSEIVTKPLRSLPYDTPGQTFVAFENPHTVPESGKFTNTLRFIVKEVDPSTNEADDDGFEVMIQLEELEVTAADYMLKTGLFRNAWESMDPITERVYEYGFRPRESLAEAVGAAISRLGMQPCEGTEVVPSNSRSHTCLLSGVFIGNYKVLVRLSFSICEREMILAARSDDESIGDAIHLWHLDLFSLPGFLISNPDKAFVLKESRGKQQEREDRVGLCMSEYVWVSSENE